MVPVRGDTWPSGAISGGCVRSAAGRAPLDAWAWPGSTEWCPSLNRARPVSVCPQPSHPGCPLERLLGYFSPMSETGLPRGSAVLAAMGVLAALLAGCTDDASQPEPPQASSSTSTPPQPDTPSPDQPSPTEPAAPALPAAAKESTKAGAKAFVTWYLRSLAYAANTGDVSDLKAASSDCAGCVDYISLYEKVYSRGGFFRDVKWTPVTWSITTESDRRSRVLVAIRAARAEYRASAKEDLKVSDEYDDAFVFELTRQMSSWAVSALTSGQAS